MSAAEPLPLRWPTSCGHADDRLAAALAAPMLPGTAARDLHLWLLRLYREVKGSEATRDGACALLHQHPMTHGAHLCVQAKVVWRVSGEDEPLNDTGNARRLAVKCGTEIAHDPATGWRIWTTAVWQPDPDGTVVQRWSKLVPQMLADEADSLYRRARVAADGDDQGAVQAGERLSRQAGQAAAWAHRSQSATAAMTKLVRDEPGVLTRAEQWDADPRLLACPGATVELLDRGHVSRPPRRADRLTRITRTRPDATIGASRPGRGPAPGTGRVTRVQPHRLSQLQPATSARRGSRDGNHARRPARGPRAGEAGLRLSTGLTTRRA